MRYHFLGGLLLAAVTVTGSAQIPNRIRPEIRPFFGAYIPTGKLQDEFKTASTIGTQVALELSSNMHLLGSVGWTNGHSKISTFTKDATYIWTYDAGVEFNAVREFGNGWLFRPLLGVGGGGRTYDFTQTGVNTKTCAAGYGALGTEFEKGVIALRFEGRNYLSCYESPVTGLKKTRNDIGLNFGVAYHLR